MATRNDADRKNDTRFVTPLLLMALVIVAGILAYTLAGHALV
jgi:hypothetical protein